VEKKQPIHYIFSIAIVLFLLLPKYNAQHYNFKKISVEQGLPRSGAYSLMQDSKGFLWISLDGGGVARFDGKNIETLDLDDGLPSRKVRALFEDSKGIIWFGTTQGLCKYDGKNIKTYTTQDGLPHNYIRAIEETKNGALIIGTKAGICFLEDSSFTTLKTRDKAPYLKKIRTIYKDPNSKIWIGTEEGVLLLRNKTLVPFHRNNELPHQRILSFLQDSKLNLWIGTQNGLVRFKNDKIKVYNSKLGLISNRVRAICEDNVGNLWIGTRTGVSLFRHNQFSNINTTNGLTHERIRDILLDNKGTLWFATYYGGINNFNPKDFVTYSKNDNFISNQILSLAQKSNGEIIAGTFDGVSTFKTVNGIIEDIKNYNTADGIPHNRVFSILEDSHNKLWIGTKKGIAITTNFEDTTWITNKEGLFGEEVFSILQEDATTFWVGTGEGLNKIVFSRYPKEFSITLHNDIAINTTDISSLVKDQKGNIWIGYRFGSVRIKMKNGNFIKPTFDTEIKNITSIKIKDNKIWVGTNATGLFLINNPNFDTTIPIKNYNKKNGLSSNNIYALAISDNKTIWSGSEKGIDKIDFNDKYVIKNIESYGKNEGIKGGEVLENALLLNSNNDLMIGTVNGFSYSSPIKYKIENKAPIIQLLKFNAYTSSKEEVKSYVNNLDEIKINYSNNNIALDFIGIDLNAPKKVKYKWFLKGFSNKWSSPSSRAFLNFTNLAPKNYELKIISSSDNKTWNESPLIIHFKIKPPFWLNPWFIALSILIFILIVILIIRWKYKKLIKTQEKLEYKIKEATQVIEVEKEKIEIQSSQIYAQKEHIEEQHKEIKQSIDYAQLIQEAALPEKKITDYIADSFLLYQPRDIVSGDFYWWEEKDDTVLFCVADSTGHGIPGAFISLIGTILYNEIFHSKNILQPNEILDELNRSLQITLEQHLPNPKIKDGMDLSFCAYNKKEQTLYFSGAQNPVWIVRHSPEKLVVNEKQIEASFNNENNISNLFEIKGDKQPIGLHVTAQTPFTLHKIQIQKGDEIYLFTDGYADQFGGDRNKKFMTKRFKKLLTQNQNQPMDKVKTLVELNFTTWKGKELQIDDVCVVGIRI